MSANRKEFFQALLARVLEMKASAGEFMADADKAGLTEIAFNYAMYDDAEKKLREKIRSFS